MTKFRSVVTIGILILMIEILILIIVTEVMVGCGQVTYFPDRTWRSNECLFVPNKISYGQW